MLYMRTTPRAWNRVRKALRKKFPLVRLGHCDEAMARALGFSSYHEALLVTRNSDFPLVRRIHADRCLTYLASRGYEEILTSSEVNLFEQLGIPLTPAWWSEGDLEWSTAHFPFILHVQGNEDSA